MKNAYKIEKKISRIDAALLHGDGGTFKDVLNISPDSIGEKSSRDHMNFSLFDFGIRDTKKVVDLWNSLPSDEPMRCFTPGYRLEFYDENQLIIKAAICWSCNWIQILKKGKEKIIDDAIEDIKDEVEDTIDERLR